MKRFIVKTWIAFAEITGALPPRWIRQLVTEKEYEQFLVDEENLTEELKRPVGPKSDLSPSLKRQLDASLATVPVGTKPERRFLPWMAVAATGFAVVIIGLTIWTSWTPSGSPVEAAPPLAIVPTPEAEPVKAQNLQLPDLPNIEDSATVEEQLFKPLQDEKAYLAADLSNAANFVAESIIPAGYMPQIRERFGSIDVKLE